MTTGNGSGWWGTLLGPSPILDGKYRLEERLGSGAMGEVFRALHLGLNKRFAVKLLHPAHLEDPGFFQRFQREAEALGSLEHPHIVRVSDFGIEPRGGGIPYLVMEELSGSTLEVLASAPLPLLEALPLLDQIAEALDHAHQRGVLHCDLKAANVLVAPGPKGDQARLVDFGLARLFPREPAHLPEPSSDPLGEGFRSQTSGRAGAQSPGASHWHGAVGTPLYLAPELTRGASPSPASDLYSFGVLSYRLLTGRHPFEGPAASLPAQHLTAPPPLPSQVHPELPPELDQALLAPLAKARSRRPASARETMAALTSAWSAAQLRTWRIREGPRRLALAGLLALVLAPTLWALGHLPPVQTLEARAGDSLFLAAPLRDPDPRLLLVVLDEASLAVDPRPLAARADETGAHLSALLNAGAAAVALDLLLPASWAESRPFAELLLRYPEQVTLALAQTEEGELVGPEALSPLVTAALGAVAADNLFAFAFLEEDSDGAVRRFRPYYPSGADLDRPVLATRLATSGTQWAEPHPRDTAPRLIDYRIDWRRLEHLSWRELESTLNLDPGHMAGRLVLVGATFTGSGDLHRIPAGRGVPSRVPGVVLQALAADTFMAGAPLRPASPFAFGVALTALLLVGSVLILLPQRAANGWRLVGASAIIYPGIVVIAFVGFAVLLPLATPLSGLVLAAVSAALMRQWLPPAPQQEVSL